MVNTGPPPETHTKNQTILPKHQSAFKSKAARILQKIIESYMERMNDNEIIDLYINKVVDERTITAKNNFKNARRFTIDVDHAATRKPKPKPDLLQQGNNFGYAL